MTDLDNKRVCLFINYYSMQWFWKQKFSTDDFYATFFIDKDKTDIQQKNKTIYDRILRLEQVSILPKRVEHMPDLTGLDKKYFLGDNFLRIPQLNRQDWERLIKMRLNRGGGQKTQPQIDLEKKIHDELRSVYNNYEKCSNEDLKTIIIFTRTKSKRSLLDAENKIKELESIINSITRKDLEGLSTIEKHAETLTTYLNRVRAVIVLEQFK